MNVDGRREGLFKPPGLIEKLQAVAGRVKRSCASLPRLYPPPRAPEQRYSVSRQPTVRERVSRPFWNDPVSSASYIRQLQGGAHSRRQTPGWAGALSVLHHHNSQLHLSIKVSNLAQAPPTTPKPRASARAGLCPRRPQRPLQRGRALGADRQADTDSGGARGSPPNSDSPRAPRAPVWSRLSRGLGGGAARPAAGRSAGRRGGGSSGEWLRAARAGEPSVEVTVGRR